MFLNEHVCAEVGFYPESCLISGPIRHFLKEGNDHPISQIDIPRNVVLVAIIYDHQNKQKRYLAY